MNTANAAFEELKIGPQLQAPERYLAYNYQSQEPMGIRQALSKRPGKTLRVMASSPTVQERPFQNTRLFLRELSRLRFGGSIRLNQDLGEAEVWLLGLCLQGGDGVSRLSQGTPSLDRSWIIQCACVYIYIHT